jgi:hypothetical protein
MFPQRNFPVVPGLKVGRLQEEKGIMGRRWTGKDIADLENLAPQYSAQTIAEKLDRSTGAVVFKAHQLKLSLLTRTQESQHTYPADLEGAGFDLGGSRGRQAGGVHPDEDR